MSTPRYFKVFNLATQQQKVHDTAAVRFTTGGQIYFTKKAVQLLDLSAGRVEIIQDPESPTDWYIVPRTAAHTDAYRLKFALGRNQARTAGAYFHSTELQREFYESIGREQGSECYGISLHAQDYYTEEGQKHPDKMYAILTSKPLARKAS